MTIKNNEVATSNIIPLAGRLPKAAEQLIKQLANCNKNYTDSCKRLIKMLEAIDYANNSTSAIYITIADESGQSETAVLDDHPILVEGLLTALKQIVDELS